MLYLISGIFGLMKKRIHTLIYFGVFVIVLFTGCFKDLMRSDIVYKNDFETGNFNNLSFSAYGSTVVTPPSDSFNGSKVLGRFNNSGMLLKLNDLPPHNAIQFSFDLYIHDNWEGDKIGFSGIPDLWAMRVNDSIQYYTTFSNSQYTQTYPNLMIGQPVSPPRANSILSTLPGVCLFKGKTDGSSYYRILQTYAHTQSTFQLQLSDALQGDKCTKSWSIDNIEIQAITY